MFTLPRKLWILPPIALGVIAIFVAPMLKSGPQKDETVERAVKVRALKVSKLDVVPRAVGYGAVKPGRVWSAVAEVAGPVIWVSPDLANGKLVYQGQDLLRIDDASYRLNLTQVEAQINASEIKDKTTRASLAIAEREYKLLADDHKRKKALVAKGAASKASLDAAERQMLNGETQMQNLKNALAINAADRQVLLSQKGQAELDLAHTVITAPYDVRVSDVSVDLAQFANKGQLLFKGDGIAVAEVEAQFPIGSLRPLIAGREASDGGNGLAQAVGASPAQGAMGLKAVIRLKTGTHDVEWPAEVSRVSGTVDAQTQSVGIVASVANPYQIARPGTRPPMMRGAFVEVELIGNPIAGQLAVPNAAIHQGKVYAIDDENRLRLQSVQVAFSQGGFSVLAKGVKPGQRIVVSDLVPAVDGMLLDPVEDKKTKMNLVSEATGVKPDPAKKNK